MEDDTADADGPMPPIGPAWPDGPEFDGLWLLLRDRGEAGITPAEAFDAAHDLLDEWALRELADHWAPDAIQAARVAQQPNAREAMLPPPPAELGRLEALRSAGAARVLALLRGGALVADAVPRAGAARAPMPVAEWMQPARWTGGGVHLGQRAWLDLRLFLATMREPSLAEVEGLTREGDGWPLEEALCELVAASLGRALRERSRSAHGRAGGPVRARLDAQHDLQNRLERGVLVATGWPAAAPLNRQPIPKDLWRDFGWQEERGTSQDYIPSESAVRFGEAWINGVRVRSARADGGAASRPKATPRGPRRPDKDGPVLDAAAPLIAARTPRQTAFRVAHHQLRGVHASEADLKRYGRAWRDRESAKGGGADK